PFESPDHIQTQSQSGAGLMSHGLLDAMFWEQGGNVWKVDSNENGKAVKVGPVASAREGEGCAIRSACHGFQLDRQKQMRGACVALLVSSW
ncbi:unnamed protein product, partial [Amoebophrya sp. A25]